MTEDIGDPHLRSQLQSVITLLQISDTWEEFISKFNKLVDHRNGQLTLKLGDFNDVD